MRTTTRFWLLLVTAVALAIPVFQAYSPGWGIALAMVGIFWALVLESELRSHVMATAWGVWAVGTGISFVASVMLVLHHGTFAAAIIQAAVETIVMAGLVGMLLLISLAIFLLLQPTEIANLDDDREARS